MEVREVDLKEYVNVIKGEKILIIIIVLFSLFSSSIYSHYLPDEYESTATLFIQGFVFNEAPNRKLALYNNRVLLRLQILSKKILSSDRAYMNSAVSAGLDEIKPFADSAHPEDEAALWINDNLDIKAGNINKGEAKFFTLRLSGELEPPILSHILNIHINNSIHEISALLEDEILIESQSLNEKRDFLLSQKAELLRSKQLSVIEVSEVTSNTTTSTTISTESMKTSPGLNSQLVAIDNQLVAIDLILTELGTLQSQKIGFIEILSPPSESKIPVGPKRALIIAIAGIIGLFGGIFAAFLKNNLIEPS